jgi:hypothetical protein
MITTSGEGICKRNSESVGCPSEILMYSVPAVRIAGIPEPAASESDAAAKAAYLQDASDVCCELVVLNRLPANPGVGNVRNVGPEMLDEPDDLRGM